MCRLFKVLFLFGVFICVAASAWGEFYKYTDAEGVLRFTDDLSMVPVDQRPDVTRYQSAKSAPILIEAEVSEANSTDSAETVSAENGQPDGGNWKQRITRQADALDRTQAKLSQTHQALQTERTALEKMASPDAATVGIDMEDYRQRIAQLNAKIVRYEAHLATYHEDVQAFNAQFK